MKIYFILFLPFFLLSSPFKIASYNVENLFDLTYNSTEYQEYIPFTHQWNKTTKEIKLNHIAEVICDIDADIIALQEIENSAILLELFKRLKEVGCGYRDYAITHTKDSAIQVALLSRFKIIDKKEIVVSPLKGVRNILEVTLKIQKRPLRLFVNHWKSKGYGGVESKRVVYAKALQRRLKQIKGEYILLGDFNSEYNVYRTLEKSLNDTNGETALNHILKTLYQGHLVDKFTLKYSGKNLHYNLWQELPFEQRWSHNFFGKKSTLDSIILPKTLFDGKGIDYSKNSFAVFKPKYLFTKKGYINRWKYHKKRHLGQGYSDHLPIYADFDTQAFNGDFSSQIAYKEVDTIEALYPLKRLKRDVLLKNCTVIFKRGNRAVIKQSKGGRGFFIYGCKESLKEQGVYDIVVQNIKVYKGLHEITHFYIQKYNKRDVHLERFYTKDFTKIKENDIIFNMIGRYENNTFEVKGKKMPIYFVKKRLKPKNGARLKIKYAHIGYYNKMQLVIYRKKDFEILEK